MLKTFMMVLTAFNGGTLYVDPTQVAVATESACYRDAPSSGWFDQRLERVGCTELMLRGGQTLRVAESMDKVSEEWRLALVRRKGGLEVLKKLLEAK